MGGSTSEVSVGCAARVAAADLLIFDFDGTLADSEALLSALVVRSLAESGLDVVAPDRIGRLIGLPLLAVLAAASGERPERLHHVAALYRRHAAAPEAIAAFRLFPGTRATLERLSRDGKRLAIATSKSRAITERILESLDLRALIRTVVGGDCVAEGRGKPHREAVDIALSRAGACRDRALVVGDTTYDIEMGRAAGVVTIAATYGMHDRATLATVQPDCFIDDIAELVA